MVTVMVLVTVTVMTVMMVTVMMSSARHMNHGILRVQAAHNRGQVFAPGDFDDKRHRR